MKLNNRGWGLQAMMACVFVLMICLVIVAVLTEKHFKEFIKPINTTYSDLEKQVVDAAKIYIKSNHINEEIITIKTLKRNNLLTDIKDIKNNDECTGYVIIENIDSKIEYNAYIKCTNYVTDGYKGSYDAK